MAFDYPKLSQRDWVAIDFVSPDHISKTIGPLNTGYLIDARRKYFSSGEYVQISSGDDKINEEYYDSRPLITAIQWDGGPTYSIHGNSTRRLPDLSTIGLLHIPEWGVPALTFEILADGYRKVIKLPVDFILEEKRAGFIVEGKRHFIIEKEQHESAALNKERL